MRKLIKRRIKTTKNYNTENAKITRAELTMKDFGALCYYLTLEGNGWGVNLGGYVIGKGYVGAEEFVGYAKGTEAIMRIMDTVGVSNWSDLEGKYVRVADVHCGNIIHCIGNIIDDKWFNEKDFFKEE